MGCSPSSPSNCICGFDNSNTTLNNFQDYCSYGPNLDCCDTIGSNFAEWGYDYTDFNCRLPNPVMLQNLGKCPPISTWAPNCAKDSANEEAKSMDQFCRSGSGEKSCCFLVGQNYYEYDLKETERGCKILNKTLDKIELSKCGFSTKVPNWRDPIVNGTTCYTTSVGTDIKSNITYTKHSSSLGNDFICLNYVTWFEAKKNYIVIASTGTLELFENMADLPHIYMNLSKCDTPLCNDPYQLQKKLDNFEPETSIQIGTETSFSCYKGVYPNVDKHVFFNVQSCVRYSYIPTYGTSPLTVYDGLPNNVLGSLVNATIFKNVFTCNTPDCNTIVIPTASTASNITVAPNISGNLNCFESVDSSSIVIPHPNPSQLGASKFCIKFKSTISNTTMYSSVTSYDAYTSYSRLSDLTICSTNLCNAPSNSAPTLKCYLTNVNDSAIIKKYDASLPVDRCVKYDIGDKTYYSGVTLSTLEILTGNPSQFKSVSSCSTNYCLVP